jgi:hypothetical protein
MSTRSTDKTSYAGRLELIRQHLRLEGDTLYRVSTGEPVRSDPNRLALGVRRRASGRWQAYSMKDGQQHTAGTYACYGQAQKAARALRQQLHGEFIVRG